MADSRYVEFVIGRTLLRRRLAEIDASLRHAPLITGLHGRPELAAKDGVPADLTFNIAHTSGVVACAITHGHRIGIDVEAITRWEAIDRVKERVFSAFELNTLARLPSGERAERLLALWTLKEAWTKALGIGLGFDFRSFSLRFDEENPKLLLAADSDQNPDEWTLERTVLAEEFRIAIAHDGYEASQIKFNEELL
jgi:4'-phosphopantetheinyl transferase